MKVTVKPFLLIRDALGGQREIEVRLSSGATISDLLSTLREKYGLPDEIPLSRGALKLFEGKEVKEMVVLKDGRNFKLLEGRETKLESGAVVALFPPLIGG